MNDRAHARPRPRWARPATWRTTAAMIATAALAVLAAGCGGSPSSAGSAGSPAAGGSADPTSAVAYSHCVRGHGVPNYPDPDSNGKFHILPEGPQGTAADHACHHLLSAGAAPMSQSQVQHALSQLLKYARCMRAHGVPNFADPQATNGMISVGAQGMDVHSPQFQAANRACQSLAAHAKG